MVTRMLMVGVQSGIEGHTTPFIPLSPEPIMIIIIFDHGLLGWPWVNSGARKLVDLVFSTGLVTRMPVVSILVTYVLDNRRRRWHAFSILVD